MSSYAVLISQTICLAAITTEWTHEDWLCDVDTYDVTIVT